ncbi:MAG: hypothetical protein C4327_01440 [Meiothermus sp.]|mgnify:CR=1 FL=1
MRSAFGRIPLFIGLALLVVALILLALLSVDYVRLSAAASTLNRTYPNPMGTVVLAMLLCLASGFFLGISVRLGRREEKPVA